MGIMSIDKTLAYIGMIATAGYAAFTLSVIPVLLFIGFLLLRVTQQFSEAYSNADTQARLDKAESLVRDAQLVTDRTQEDIEHRLKNFDRELDERIDVFVRGANTILGNMNVVTASVGYGESLKSVEKSTLKRKGE